MRVPGLLVVFLVLAGCSEQPAAPQESPRSGLLVSSQGVVHRVSIGGPDICFGLNERPGCDANLTLIALEMADGSVRGQWEDVSGQLPGHAGAESPLHAVVTCIEISTLVTPLGTVMQAWVGGVVTYPASLEGHPVIIRVRDRGTSNNEPADVISRSIVDPQDEGISANCHDRPLMGFAFAPQGQVMIR